MAQKVLMGTEHQFPKEWTGPPHSIECKYLSPVFLPGLRGQIADELGKYPFELVDDVLSCVFVYETITVAGVSVAGMRSWNKIFLARQSDVRSMALAIHGEFSSLVVLNNVEVFDKDAWGKLNPTGFEYREERVPLRGLLAGSSGAIDESLFHMGLLTTYGATTWENDFNSFAKWVFVDDDNLWAAVARHPALARKARFCCQFFRRLYPAHEWLFLRRL